MRAADCPTRCSWAIGWLRSTCTTSTGVVRGNRLTGTVASGDRQRTARDRVAPWWRRATSSAGSGGDGVLAANTFSDNALALVVTDLSTAYVHADNVFGANELDVSASMQKRHFGGGTVVLAGEFGPAVETDGRVQRGARRRRSHRVAPPVRDTAHRRGGIFFRSLWPPGAEDHAFLVNNPRWSTRSARVQCWRYGNRWDGAGARMSGASR